MTRSAVLALLAAIAAPAAAQGAPVPGSWTGTATQGEHSDRIVLKVIDDAGRPAATGLRTTALQQCADSATGVVQSTKVGIAVSHLPIKGDGSFRAAEGDVKVTGRFTSPRRGSGTIAVAAAARECEPIAVTFRIEPVPVGAVPVPTPVLTTFAAEGRIASGRVAGYDLREEATAFRYRIRAERVRAQVQRRSNGRWVTIGTVTARPPAPLDFWPVFRSMGNGAYRILARAQNGGGRRARFSRPRAVRFTVVSHIPHSDRRR